MRSGCAADAQQARSVTTAVVEAKKDKCANDAPPKSPEDSVRPTTSTCENFCVKLGQNQGQEFLSVRKLIASLGCFNVFTCSDVVERK